MDVKRYHKFTERLRARLERDDRVIGLVAVGSMAGTGHAPDEWSDHDFYVIVQTGAQEQFRTDMAWLPDAERIALWFRETAHGLKVLYDDGHLLEFAVFDPQELHLAKVNDQRVLLDRGVVQATIDEIVAATCGASPQSANDDLYQCGMFLCNLWVGVGRHRRGEGLSGQRFVKDSALGHLLTLIERHVPAPRRALIDNLDVHRRFEFVYPALGGEIASALLLETPQAALALLDLAERELAPHVPNYPHEGAAVIRRAIRRA